VVAALDDSRVAGGVIVKIILCDLNATLSRNWKAVFPSVGRLGMARTILEVEQYRPELVKWLSEAGRHGWETHLFTVRDARWAEATLESIRSKTGWQPDNAWFNDTQMSNKEAARVKAALFDRVLEECELSGLFGLESNEAVRRMYRRRHVACQRGTDPLPSPAELEELGRWPPCAA